MSRHDPYHPSLVAEVEANGRTYRVYDDGTYYDGRGIRHLPYGIAGVLQGEDTKMDNPIYWYEDGNGHSWCVAYEWAAEVYYAAPKEKPSGWYADITALNNKQWIRSHSLEVPSTTKEGAQAWCEQCLSELNAWTYEERTVERQSDGHSFIETLARDWERRLQAHLADPTNQEPMHVGHLMFEGAPGYRTVQRTLFDAEMEEPPIYDDEADRQAALEEEAYHREPGLLEEVAWSAIDEPPYPGGME